MKFASLWFEILKGGPFDGLPSLCLRFEEEEATLDLGSVFSLLTSMSPPPMHLRILYVAGDVVVEDIVRLLTFATSYGMATSVEIYDAFEPWMLQCGWRCLHTKEMRVPHPVEEIVFHTEEVPRFVPFPFHVVKMPLLWWAPPKGIKDVFEVLPQNMRLWVPRRTIEKKLLPEEER